MTNSRHHLRAQQATINQPPRVAVPLAAALTLLAVLLWTYWDTIVPLFKDWQNDDNYSVGQIVPLAALYLLWRDRKRIKDIPVSPTYWGLALILAGQAARFYGLLFLFESAERYSIVLTLAGVVLLVTGWRMFRQVGWILLFLLLMVPLPGRVHNMITGPLQSQATAGAVFMIELVGVSVARQGNTMVLNNNTPLAVAEACNGLRMLTAFIVVAAVLAYLVRRPKWQKITLLLSSVPIAIACNLVRLFVTAILFMHTNSETAEKFFHDFAGIAMMPLAVLLLGGELWLMDKLVIPDNDSAAAGGDVHKNHESAGKKPKRRPAVATSDK